MVLRLSRGDTINMLSEKCAGCSNYKPIAQRRWKWICELWIDYRYLKIETIGYAEINGFWIDRQSERQTIWEWTGEINFDEHQSINWGEKNNISFFYHHLSFNIFVKLLYNIYISSLHSYNVINNRIDLL